MSDHAACARAFALAPASQWSAARRITYGLIGVLAIPGIFHVATTGPHPRSVWFGAFATFVYLNLFAWVLLAPQRLEAWGRRRGDQVRDAIRPFLLTFGIFTSLTFASLGIITSLPLTWCAVISFFVYLVSMGLSLLRTKYALRQRPGTDPKARVIAADAGPHGYDEGSE